MESFALVLLFIGAQTLAVSCDFVPLLLAQTEVFAALTKETMHGCDPVLAQLREVKTSLLRRAAYVRMEAKLV